jgi:hypothetical protein
MGLTLEALAALQRSRFVFGFQDTAWISSYVEQMGSRYVELDYPPIARRLDIMTLAAKTVASAALTEPPVAFIAAGSPLRHVWLSAVLIQWAREQGIRIATVLGVSSLDHVCAALGVEDSGGLQLYDATHLLLLQQRPDPSAHCFVFNLENTLMQRSCISAIPRAEMLELLKQRLLEFYASDHEATFVLTETPRAGAHLFRLELARLEEAITQRPLGTLYLPPSGSGSCERVGALDDLMTLVRLSRSPLDGILGSAAAEFRRMLESTANP